MKVLLLGGSQEARQLSWSLRGHDAVVSLAGSTEKVADYGLPVQHGGFGGAVGLADYLTSGGFTHVVDATHPFAETMKEHAAVASVGVGVACIHLIRPGWGGTFGGETVAGFADAAAVLTAGSRVFLALGVQHLQEFRKRSDVVMIARTIDPQPPDDTFIFISARPPFTVEEELALLREYRIDTLVARDSGGASGVTKLIAARQLNLRRILVARPVPPRGVIVDNIGAVLNWLDLGDTDGRAHH